MGLQIYTFWTARWPGKRNYIIWITTHVKCMASVEQLWFFRIQTLGLNVHTKYGSHKILHTNWKIKAKQLLGSYKWHFSFPLVETLFHWRSNMWKHLSLVTGSSLPTSNSSGLWRSTMVDSYLKPHFTSYRLALCTIYSYGVCTVMESTIGLSRLSKACFFLTNGVGSKTY